MNHDEVALRPSLGLKFGTVFPKAIEDSAIAHIQKENSTITYCDLRNSGQLC